MAIPAPCNRPDGVGPFYDRRSATIAVDGTDDGTSAIVLSGSYGAEWSTIPTSSTALAALPSDRALEPTAKPGASVPAPGPPNLERRCPR